MRRHDRQLYITSIRQLMREMNPANGRTVMTQMIYVGSKSEKSILVPVEESGIDQREVRSRAIQFARARYGIADPIALNEHEAAVRQRLQILAEHAPRMVDLNGHGQPFWRLRGNKYYN